VVRSLALQAWGLAAGQQHDPTTSVSRLREAVEIAAAAGRTHRAAMARADLAFVLLSSGDPRAALVEADRAAEDLDGIDAVRLQVRRALVLQRLGRLDEALTTYDLALADLRAAGDRFWEAKGLTNRGVLQAYRSRFEAAREDLVTAERIYLELDQPLAAAQVRHNLGFVAARRGDVPAALQAYDEADARHRSVGITDVVGMADRCELLLSARLLEEAEELATRAVLELEATGLASDLPEARLTLANVALLRDDPRTARDQAALAETEFDRQDRAAWAVLARYVQLQADGRGGHQDADLLARAQQVAGDLAASGWATAAADATLVAAQVALQLGELDVAERQLKAQRPARRRGPVELRARAWHADALLRLARGDRDGAESALRNGMRTLDRHRATLGATELRVRVAGHAGALARLGTRLALEDGDAERVLAWAERWRAGALSLRPARPPDDDQQVADLAALRDLAADIGEAALAGRDTAPLLRRQAALERAVQQRSRRATPGRAGPGAVAVPAVSDLAPALGDAALVELVRLDGILWAVVVAAGRAELVRVGPERAAAEELAHLRFALQRLAVRGSDGPAGQRATRAADHAAVALDEVLLGPLRDHLGGRALVLAPTGVLHAVPWGLLPSLAGRRVTVVPSAQLWRRADAARAGADAARAGADVARAGVNLGRIVLAGCDDPPNAVDEVEAIAAHHPGAVTLTGERATVAAVTDQLEGAALAHLACHGRFRGDNPLFSCLELHDGPLTVHDLERRDRMPRTLVLSACESGRAGVEAGDELMGLSSALFSLGAATLIASVAPVRDDATGRVMVDLHARLAAGAGPADALAAVTAAADDPATRFTAASFVTFGAG
jgi:tetratricopeptide (TPR) repeat protein